ncbi:MAG: hypothetical protein WBM04_08945, partial [Candidatus Korobacteraceae bacterium]
MDCCGFAVGACSGAGFTLFGTGVVSSFVAPFAEGEVAGGVVGFGLGVVAVPAPFDGFAVVPAGWPAFAVAGFGGFDTAGFPVVPDTVPCT